MLKKTEYQTFWVITAHYVHDKISIIVEHLQSDNLGKYKSCLQLIQTLGAKNIWTMALISPYHLFQRNFVTSKSLLLTF